ncbi:MAG: AraC family transcriptional regulator [Lachnospiraceae bacterium]|nr:AraC family transcriptional regulator [Lachnospiraceae bacterium]
MINTENENILFENQNFARNYSVNVSWKNVPTFFPVHWHTYGEIIWAMKDDLIFSIQGQNYRLLKNDILFIWPGELHSTVQADAASHLIVQFSNSLLSGTPEMAMLLNRILSVHHISSDADRTPAAEIIHYMGEIQKIFSLEKPLIDTRLCLSLTHILLSLYDYCTECTAFPSSENPAHRLHTIQSITKACCYITENCQKNLTLEEVAEYAGISKYHFSRSFKEYTQTSFCDYLAIQRIQKAIILFENPGISIAEAAFQSGFGSIASFNRCFRKYKNCTPSSYRDLLANPH